MAKNVFTQFPRRGDIVVKDIATKTPHYVELDSFVPEEFDSITYETVGEVYWVGNGNVGVVYKQNAAHQFCNRVWWYLSDYILDGAEHTGTISAFFASNSWASAIDKTITYHASNMEGVVNALNAAFTTDDDFLSQDWWADIYDGKVRIHCNNISWQQCYYNTVHSGFKASSPLPEIGIDYNIRRKHGYIGRDGAISCFSRAISYFRNDNTEPLFNPSSDVTTVKLQHPICLPAYLGKSQYQSDHCALLRSVYGDNEEGWIRFMKSCAPVLPTDYGSMGICNGKERTRHLSSFMFTSSKVTEASPMCMAAYYCRNVSSKTVDKGEFWLATPEELSRLMYDIEYGVNPSHDSDRVNRGLRLIGGSYVHNGAHWWTCLRSYSNGALMANGGYGYFYDCGMYYFVSCAPVSLYPLRSNA